LIAAEHHDPIAACVVFRAVPIARGWRKTGSIETLPTHGRVYVERPQIA
jgi:hypothetical protein